MKTILGLTRSDAGKILIDGERVGDDPSYRSLVGYMPQIARFPENLSAAELIAMLRDLRGEDAEIDDELVRRFRLEDQLAKPLRVLSGGTRQKVNAVLAFLFRPELLVLDEPTAGLDPVASGVLKAKILRVRRAGVSVLLVSHALTELEELVDDVVFLVDGAVKFEGSLRRLKQATGEPRLERAIAHLMQPTAP
jgi:Cu-processing system ATP-binding protein